MAKRETNLSVHRMSPDMEALEHRLTVQSIKRQIAGHQIEVKRLREICRAQNEAWRKNKHKEE